MPPTFTDEGLVAAQKIRRDHPQVATLVLSQYVELDYALKLVTGTSDRVGYLLKDRIGDVNDFIYALERGVRRRHRRSNRPSSRSSSARPLPATR